MKRPYFPCLSKVLKLVLLVATSACCAEEVTECESYFTLNYPDRYLINAQQGTVIDKVTGLMWDRCYYGLTGENCEYLLSNPTQLADPETALHTVINATPAQHIANVNQANEENYRGYNDWHMPNIKQLAALADSGCVSYYREGDSVYIVSQPARVFPLLSSLYKTGDYINRNYMISSTPVDRKLPNKHLAFSLSTAVGVFNWAPETASGVIRSFGAMDIDNNTQPNLFSLKLVRKVNKTEFKTALTPTLAINE